VEGCDSAVTVNLTVKPSYRFTNYHSICQGDSLLLPDGTFASVAGTYQVTLSTTLNCDSAIITNLSVFPVYTTIVDTSICTGDSYLLADSTTVGVDGTYSVLLQSVRGCDSTVITNLTLRNIYTVEVFDTICQGQVYFLPDGQPAYAGGTYPVTLSSTLTCDSTIITNLTVNPVYNITRNVTICQGSSYVLPDGQVVAAPGSYPVILPTVDGCDSLILTNLTVRLNSIANRSVSICQGDTFALPDGIQVTAPGIYTTYFLTVYGCDSIIRTILNVRPVYTINRSVDICQGSSYQLPGGLVVTAPGVYTDTFQTIYGCDSTIITTLSVRQNYSVSRNVSICQGSSYILPDNTIVSSQGNYPVMLSSVYGCDSLVTIHLSVGNVISNTVYPSICQGETYTLPGGQIVGSPGTYFGNYLTSTGCDSSVTVVLSVYPNYDIQLTRAICQGETYLLPNGVLVNTSGVYPVLLQAQGGCDSSITTTLTVNSSYAGTFSRSVCQGQVFTLPDGRQVTTPGSYLSVFSTPFGCDSTILTQLSVVPPSTWNESIDLCLGEIHLLPDGVAVDTDGVYQSVVTDVSGCDSLIFTFVTTVGFTPAPIVGPNTTNHWSTETYLSTYVAGRFYNWRAIGGQILQGQGTNSVQVVWNRSGSDTLILRQFDTQCFYDDTLVVDALFTGVAGIPVQGATMAYPVPFSERLIVAWPEDSQPTAVILYDLSGRAVMEEEVGDTRRIELATADLAPGCYLVGFKGDFSAVLRVVKQ
jgi:hypothetical protein